MTEPDAAAVAELVEEARDEWAGLDEQELERRMIRALAAAEKRIEELTAAPIFIVMGAFDYEGYSEPEAVYASRDAAEEHAGKLRNAGSYDDVSVLEYPVTRALTGGEG